MSNYFINTGMRVVVCKKKDGSWCLQTRVGDEVLAETKVEYRIAHRLMEYGGYSKFEE